MRRWLLAGTRRNLLLPVILLAALIVAACQPAAIAERTAVSVTLEPRAAATATTSHSPTRSPLLVPAETATPVPVLTVTPAGAAATPGPTPVATTSPTAAAGPNAALPVYTYRVVNVYPHDPAAFTQGLVYQDGAFYEGTGLRGQSTLRRVDPATGQVLQGIDLPDQYFGEGIAVLGDNIYQLSWKENTGFVYDKNSFDLLDTWSYPGEGWGLTTDGQRLIMSDGSPILHFLDPVTLQEVSRVAVAGVDGNPVGRLNELEYIGGEVYANVWQTDWIVRIDPATGHVVGLIDLRGLLPAEDRQQRVDVLNGIAYDAAADRLFVTGKWWPKLFEIELVEATPAR